MTSARVNIFLLIIFGLTLPVSVVLSTNLARRSFEKVKLRDQAISVKGYAEREITSDYGQWSATINAENADLKLAYGTLADGREKTIALLEKNGFDRAKVSIGPASIMTLRKRDAKGNETNEIEKYRVNQGLWVDSGDVKLIDKVAREASDLISLGVEIESGSPRFYYTKMDQMKLKMLGEASANARARAEQMVGDSGRLGGLKSASQGVFQITPPLSTDVAYDGMNDTGSINKVVKAVVTLEYGIE